MTLLNGFVKKYKHKLGRLPVMVVGTAYANFTATEAFEPETTQTEMPEMSRKKFLDAEYE